MKIREVMTVDPVCCLPFDSAQKAARMLCEQNIGSMPVVADHQSRELMGMITDRDLCCSVLAEGLDAKNTAIDGLFSPDPVNCREDDNLEKCERAMQEHQIRRIPVVDAKGCCIGIVSQADLALNDRPDEVSKTVAEISRPEPPISSIAA